MLGKIKFCRDRIFERDLQYKHRKVINRLEAMENPREYTTDEQLRLYKVFLDQLTNAVTSPHSQDVDSFIGLSEKWIAKYQDGIRFRNKFRGEAQEAWEEAQEDEKETAKLLEMISVKENEKQMKMQKETVRKKEQILTKTMNKIKTEVVKTGI
jgi:Lon protease-like protein|tara:strand:- start:1686 stop:2147 length:462 start_codon:yes stop_codon:yes gene_type:complete